MRRFDITDVISITDGRLVSTRHMDGVYDILNYMTGDNLFTHVLPRAAEACRPVLLAQHPQLDGCMDHFEFTEDREALEQCNEFVVELKSRFGDTLPIEPLDEWAMRNPIEELAEMIPPERIIVVEM